MHPSELSLFKQNRLPHALLITGATLCEKQQLAIDIAEYLLADKADWVKENTHPDFVMLVKDEQNPSIKIEEVRSIIEQLTQASHQGGYRIVVFSPAEAMPIGAQNALLKTLEEPPKNTLILLISEYPALLSATIRSRCQKIVLPSVAQTLVPDPALLKTLEQLKQRKITSIDAAQEWQSVPLMQFLDQLLLSSIELIKQQIANHVSTQALFVWYDQINLARAQILAKANPNHLLLLENLFYGFCHSEEHT